MDTVIDASKQQGTVRFVAAKEFNQMPTELDFTINRPIFDKALIEWANLNQERFEIITPDKPDKEQVNVSPFGENAWMLQLSYAWKTNKTLRELQDIYNEEFSTEKESSILPN